MAKEKDHVTVYWSATKGKYVAVSAWGTSAEGADPKEARENLRAEKSMLGDCQNVWELRRGL